jgi:tetratricopeptide (TPR) repeat protein
MIPALILAAFLGFFLPANPFPVSGGGDSYAITAIAGLQIEQSISTEPEVSDTISATPQSLFNEGNYHLEQQRYQDAMNRYRQISAMGFGSGPLYLNMGISYTHMDSLGQAKYYFLKALEFRQSRDAATEGLRHVDLMLSQLRPNLPVLPVAAFYDRLYFEIGSIPFFITAILLFNLAALCLVISWYRPRFAGWTRTIAVLLVIGSLAALGSGLFVDAQSSRYTRAVLVYNDSVVREQPFIDAPVVASAHVGYTFTVDRETSVSNPDWYYVRLTNGLEGWIPRTGISRF